MKKKFKLFCFGFGQVAKYFIRNLVKKKIEFELITTNTNKTEFRKFHDLKFKSYYFLDNKFDNNLLHELDSSDKILISIPPINQKDIVLETFSRSFEKYKFNWVTYLSATSVYGDKNGQWVDENTSPNPTSKRGIARLTAEQNWLKYCEDFNLPIQIFRLSGIYSIENNIIKRLTNGNLKIVEKQNHFFSRIHVEDIAEVLTISLKNFNSGEIYNISDNYPCSNLEIAEYTSKLIKINTPPKIKFDDLKEGMLREFYNDSKKVSNKKMKFFFKYTLKYPTFKEGLDMIQNHMI